MADTQSQNPGRCKSRVQIELINLLKRSVLKEISPGNYKIYYKMP